MKGYVMKTCKRIIQYPITVWMIVSVLALSAVYISFAAYNGTANVKRVVSTQPTSSTFFSSNYMEVYSSSNIAVKNLRTTNEGNFICSVTVCNYDQLDPTSPARAQIDYSFLAELVRYDSVSGEYVVVSEVQNKDNGTAKSFWVQKKVNDNQPITSDTQHSINSAGSFSYLYSSESLAGGNPYRDSFDICFDASEVAKDVPELYIRVTATPTEESVQMNSGISILSSVISIAQGRIVQTGWHGNLQESSLTDYDGYNLTIEGSGAGKIDILWDSNKFTMNPAFVTLYSGTILSSESDVAGREGWKKRTLTVNSINSNRYVVQFYKKVSGTYTGTEFPSKYIKCENYVADDSQTVTPTP